MTIFITGATGYIGHSLAMKLAEKGNKVHALVRSTESPNVPRHSNIQIFKGDILNSFAIASAIKGCEAVFHTAASVKVWTQHPDDVFKPNVEGTANVLAAAAREGVSKFVFTSTCGVIGPGLGEPMTENDPRIIGFKLDYELSKKMAEDIVLRYAQRGMFAIIVSPAKVYGPGKATRELSANTVINRYLKTGMAIVPSPPTFKSCFAFVDDVIEGHLLALEKGKPGEKYILGGINVSHKELFVRIRELSSRKGYLIETPKNIIKSWALIQQMNFKISGKMPFFSGKAVDHLFKNYCFSSEKAIRDLGYRITPFDEALQKTIHYLKTQYHA